MEMKIAFHYRYIREVPEDVKMGAMERQPHRNRNRTEADVSIPDLIPAGFVE
jgi:hypothetical protein